MLSHYTIALTDHFLNHLPHFICDWLQLLISLTAFTSNLILLFWFNSTLMECCAIPVSTSFERKIHALERNQWDCDEGNQWKAPSPTCGSSAIDFWVHVSGWMHVWWMDVTSDWHTERRATAIKNKQWLKDYLASVLFYIPSKASACSLWKIIFLCNLDKHTTTVGVTPVTPVTKRFLKLT